MRARIECFASNVLLVDDMVINVYVQIWKDIQSLELPDCQIER